MKAPTELRNVLIIHKLLISSGVIGIQSKSRNWYRNNRRVLKTWLISMYLIYGAIAVLQFWILNVKILKAYDEKNFWYILRVQITLMFGCFIPVVQTSHHSKFIRYCDSIVIVSVLIIFKLNERFSV